jgi:hypothetical protein
LVDRAIDDPWLGDLRQAPVATLNAALPHLSRLIGAFDIASEIKIRRVDLYVHRACPQAGIVLVGVAFATSCQSPAPASTRCSPMWNGSAGGAHPGLVCDRARGRGQVRRLLRQFSQSGLRCLVGGQSIRLP